jgi:hypothetical protein
VVGYVTNWYQSKKVLSGIAQQVVRDVTNWYQSPVFNTEPGWAELASCRSRIFAEKLNSGVTEFQVTVRP